MDEFYRIRLTTAEALATLTVVKAMGALLSAKSDTTLPAGMLDEAAARFAEELPEFAVNESERLAAALAIDVVDALRSEMGNSGSPLDEPPFPTGENRLALMGALEKRQPVEIEYYVRSRNEWSRRNVDIQNVYVSGDAWFVSGHCRLRDEFRLFRIDHIRSVRALDEDDSDPFSE